MSTVTHDIVAKLWNLCNVLKDDGVTYHQYVTKLTYLLFLKMAKETGTEDQIPEGYRWDDLERETGTQRLARSHFAEFEAAFGDDPLGRPASLAQRQDTGEPGRFRRFTREWIADRNENLDIAWLRDESETSAEDLPEPATLAQESMVELEAAIDLPVTLARTLSCRESWQNWEKR